MPLLPVAQVPRHRKLPGARNAVHEVVKPNSRFTQESDEVLAPDVPSRDLFDLLLARVIARRSP